MHAELDLTERSEEILRAEFGKHAGYRLYYLDTSTLIHAYFVCVGVKWVWVADSSLPGAVEVGDGR